MLTVIATLIRSPDTDEIKKTNRSSEYHGCCSNSFWKKIFWQKPPGKALEFVIEPKHKSILLFIMKVIITIFTITGRGILIDLSLSSGLTKWPIGDVVFIIGECMVSYVEVIDFIYEQKKYSEESDAWKGSNEARELLSFSLSGEICNLNPSVWYWPSTWSVKGSRRGQKCSRYRILYFHGNLSLVFP